MRTVSGILSFILLTFPNPIELSKRHKENAVHPAPILLDLRPWHGIIRVPRQHRAGIWSAVIRKEMGQEYIIGINIEGKLRAIMTNSVRNKNYTGRVKVRINGDVAEVPVMIPEEDPLNDLFYLPIGSTEIIRKVHIPE